MSTAASAATLVVTAERSLITLNRIVSVLRARQCEVASLTVSRAESPNLQRLSIAFEGTQPRLSQVAAWLRKLEEVQSVSMVNADADAREWLLVTIPTDALTSRPIMSALAAGSCHVVARGNSSVVIEAVGSRAAVDRVVAALPEDAILEINRCGPVQATATAAANRQPSDGPANAGGEGVVSGRSGRSRG
jgi:acetolactate synthase small subunit